MKTRKILAVLALCLLVWLAGVSEAIPMGTAFTYQGHLYDTNDVANALYDFAFKLYDANVGGSKVGTDVNVADVDVIDGYFSVELDFGSGLFNGEERWLEIGVRPGEMNDPNVYTVMEPRKELTPTPYALALSGLRIEPNAISPNVIGGYRGNSVTMDVAGATISGGGKSGYTNQVTDDYGTVRGGVNNRAGDATGTSSDRPYATIGGGVHNIASHSYATVGGGYGNSASSDYCTIGGGKSNQAYSWYATVGGGIDNIGGASRATVGGGASNTATGWYATVPGGRDNYAIGDYSFAAGFRARADHEGAFVWTDSTGTFFESTGNDQFLVRASGGVGIGTNSPTSPLTVNGLIESTTNGFKFPDATIRESILLRHVPNFMALLLVVTLISIGLRKRRATLLGLTECSHRQISFNLICLTPVVRQQ